MAADYVPLTMEQIEALVEEVIEANAVWPDPLSSQVDAVMDVLREAMAQAWDEGNGVGFHNACAITTAIDEPVDDANPYRVNRPEGDAS